MVNSNCNEICDDTDRDTKQNAHMKWAFATKPRRLECWLRGQDLMNVGRHPVYWSRSPPPKADRQIQSRLWSVPSSRIAAKSDFMSATTGSRTQITCDSRSFLLPASTRRFRFHRRVFLVRLIEPLQGIHMPQKAPLLAGGE